jgi:HAE1 family hydrophobic/amphiphilic exporter-1
MAHRRTMLGLFAISILGTVTLFRAMPEDFLPSEDTGQLLAFTEGANGISFEVMQRHQDEAAKMLWSDPNLQGTLSSVGYGGARGGSNQGYLRIGLKPRSERPPIDEVIAELRRKLAAIPGLNVYLQNRPVITIGGLISKAQYQYTLQDSNTAELFAASERLKNALAKTPGFLDVTSDLDLSTPSVHVSVDRDRAAALGITMSQIETALGASFGGQQISTINSATDQFKVMLELLPQYQQDAAALNLLYLATPRSASVATANVGSVVPLSTVTHITTGASPLAINHFGQLPAVTISFSLPPGVALSDAVTNLEEVERQVGMPASVLTSFQGTAKAFQESMQGIGFLLIGAILVVYIVLGILYENFIHPLTIIYELHTAAMIYLYNLYLL